MYNSFNYDVKTIVKEQSLMKKRLIGILSIVLVLAVLSASAIGCTFVKENEYRTANETYVTINHKGVKLTISYNEFLDYCNTSSRLYYYVNYYGLEVGEALDLCIKGKIQSKYLTAEAMAYLVDSQNVSAERVNALYGKGSKVNPVDVLTYAERYQAIYAVNESIREALESNKEDAKQDAYSSAYRKISTTDIKEIVFTDATKAYLDRFTEGGVVVGAELDTDQVKIQVVYNDDTRSDEFVVPESLYTTAFSSEADSSATAKEVEKTIVITVTDEANDEDEEDVEYTLEYDYTLVYPRTTKEEPAEEDDYSVVEIDEAKVNRYALDADIPQAVKDQCKIIDLDAEYAAAQANGADKYEIEAYRVLIDTLKSGNHDMAYYYSAQYESAVLSALTAEIYLKSDASFSASDVDSKIISDFRYLAENAKKSYDGKDADEIRSAFVSAIGSSGAGLDTLYYIPAIDDLSNYVYVKQILFKFDEETTTFLATLSNDEDALDKACEYFRNSAKVLPSNPDYDADYECPLHALKEEGATCKHEGEEGICPSIPYGEEELLKDVIDRMSGEFSAILESSDEDKYQKAQDLFDKYIYTYNDDSGTFNNDWGYLIAPEESDNSWVKEFTKLGQDLISYNSNPGNVYKNGGTLAECFTRSLSGGTSDYAGVSIMMVSAKPFDGRTALDAENMTDEEVLAYLKSWTAGDGTALYETFKKNLRDEARSTAYSDFTLCVPTDIFERNDKNKITVDDSVKDEIEIETKKLKEAIYDEYVG